MIILKDLKWSNAFSYGTGNHIDLSNNKLTQLVGLNGHGKSSIALILEEVLFNKNSKGIKKADILNRNSSSSTYEISLSFTKVEDLYTIETIRGKTQKVSLTKNGVDISAHTATNTYKIIEIIIGMDHKTFTQIVYQAHATSLEFLRSADTARKKFLIELLDLNRYIKIGEYFRSLAGDMSRELGEIKAKIETVRSFSEKYSSENTEKKSIELVPEPPKELLDEALALQGQLATIQQVNKGIQKNNTYHEMLVNIGTLPAIIEPKETSTLKYVSKKGSLIKEKEDAEVFIRNISKLGAICPTCEQPVDLDKIQELSNEKNAIIGQTTVAISECNSSINLINKSVSKYQEAVDKTNEYERIYNLIDHSLSTEILNEEDLKKELNLVNESISIITSDINRLKEDNTKATIHNNKVDLIRSQLEDMEQEMLTLISKFEDLEYDLSVVQTLVKTFGTTGLVAYKIEYLVTELEDLSNKYLSELSEGRFQISFQISGNDKLNVVITDSGQDVSIQALSAGESARVNVSVLLAIRVLMNSLYEDSRINLLILDETISTLDVEGKEKLVEVLLAEDELQTILVSHDFTHPLIEKVEVVKTNNISEIK